MQDGWIERSALLEQTGLSAKQLEKLSGLLPRPVVRSLGRGLGKRSFYPPGTVGQIRRIQGLKRDGLRLGEIRFVLWLEGFALDFRSAMLRSFDNLLATAATRDKADKVKEAAVGTFRRLARNRVRQPEELAELVNWAFAIVTGSPLDVSLRDPDSWLRPALLKLGGLPHDYGWPTDNLSFEQWSIRFLRDVAATIDENEMEHVRLFYVWLERLAAAFEGVSLDSLPRHARGTLAARGDTITQDTIAFFLKVHSATRRLVCVPCLALVLRAGGENAERWLSLGKAAVGENAYGEDAKRLLAAAAELWVASVLKKEPPPAALSRPQLPRNVAPSEGMP